MNSELSWILKSICSPDQVNLFYSVIEEEIQEARRFCLNCPVIEECFQYAIEHHEEGVWGGTSEKQRRRLFSRAVVMGVPVTSLQRSKPREQLRLVNACSFDLSGISFHKTHTPAVSEKRFASLRVQFHTV